MLRLGFIVIIIAVFSIVVIIAILFVSRRGRIVFVIDLYVRDIVDVVVVPMGMTSDVRGVIPPWTRVVSGAT